MKNILIILPVILVLLVASAFTFRIYKDINKKLKFANTYAIKNVETGRNIRVHNAGIDDGTKIIIYSPHNWECMTWQLIQLENNAYLLKNLYTEKTFQPSSNPAAGVELWQQTLGGSRLQYWEFIKQPDEKYLIRLKDTELYLTVTSGENNSPVVLMPEQNSTGQQWKLLRQNPVL